jgi:signal transduction histidine kinase
LDIRGMGEQPFPPQATSIAELFGQQLGLYTYLSSTIYKLRQAKVELSGYIRELHALQEQKLQAFQDLEHQIKSPILQARIRVQKALNDGTVNKQINVYDLHAVRGLCAKAFRVSGSLGLFASLARGEKIEPRTSSCLNAEDVFKMLVEAAQDSKITSARGDVDFRVVGGRFDRYHHGYGPIRELLADKDLLQQALSNVLDNAGKYSYPRSVVLISGGRTGSGGFFIAVENRGIPIRHSEVKLCTERGWKGEMARQVTDAGSGIGLWLVRNIMEAHNGQLIVEPTTRDACTIVRLVFPNERVK